VCHGPLTDHGAHTLDCPVGHSFDVARQGYVNLLGNRRRRAAGDSVEMVRARRAFLATGAYQPVSDHLNRACGASLPGKPSGVLLDAGCGEGYYTRRLAGTLDADLPICGIDVAKPAISTAAAQHRQGRYAVASAFDLPLADGSVSVLVSVFGPVVPGEFARVVAPGGAVIAVHPGPGHLSALRSLVYDAPRRHQVKDPLRDAQRWFRSLEHDRVRFQMQLSSTEAAIQLLTMTPYRWHAPRDINARLAQLGGLETDVDVLVSRYRRIA
jgi:23S rRNA (guanine745-N1)-methyltransferase